MFSQCEDGAVERDVWMFGLSGGIPCRSANERAGRYLDAESKPPLVVPERIANKARVT